MKSKIYPLITTLFLFYNISLYSQTTPENAQSPFGINLSAIDPWESDWTFVNIANHSLAWHPVEEIVEWHEILPQNILTSTGYIPGGTDGILSIIWDSPRPINGTFVLTWEGDATAEIHDQWSSPQLISSTTHRMEFRLNGDRFLFIKFTNNTNSNPLKNIRCVKSEDESNTKVFTSALTEYLKHFKVIRFTHFTNTNNSSLVDWSGITEGCLFQNNARYDYNTDFRHIPSLCNELKINPWISIPLNASNQFITSLVEEVFPLFDDDLTIYTELSNEVWNESFSQHHEAAEKARLLNLSNTGNSWEDAPVYYGHRSAQMHDIVDAKMTDEGISNKHCRLLAWQAVNSFFLTNLVLPAYEAAVQNNRKPDLLAIAPFFGGGLGSPANEAIVENWSLDQLFQQLEFGNIVFTDNSSIPDIETALINYNEVADENGIPGVITYEMGQHLVGYGGVESNDKITVLFNAANRDPRMKNMYTAYFSLLKENNIKMHGLFTSTSLYNKWGSWGTKEYISQTDAPKFDAVLEFKNSNPVHWNECLYDFTSSADNEKPHRNPFIYPNPTFQIVTASLYNNEEITGYLVTTGSGIPVTNVVKQVQPGRFDVSFLDNGLYILQLKTTNDVLNFTFIKM